MMPVKLGASCDAMIGLAEAEAGTVHPGDVGFSDGQFDAAHWAQIALGYFVPERSAGLTYIRARLTRR
jgi:hypothetical protein